MCSLHTMGLAALAGLGFVAPAPAQNRAALRRHADRLISEYRRVGVIAARRDTFRARQVPVDTILVGDLRIVAARSVAARARQAADTAWPELSEMFGGATREIRQVALVIQVSGQPEGQIDALPPMQYLSAPQGSDAGTLAHVLVYHAANLMSWHQDRTLQYWLLGTLTPPLRASERLHVVYQSLATSPFSKPQACYVGDRAACQAALGLSGADDPILGWYDAIDRRRLARDFADFARRSGHLDVVRCAEGAVDSVCVAGLRDLPSTVRLGEPPLSGGDRLSLAATALDLGGPGAYERLLATAGRPMADRLAAASRLGADSLVAVWRARVMAARPHTVAFQLRAAWAAVFWGTLFGVLALRSTRWR